MTPSCSWTAVCARHSVSGSQATAILFASITTSRWYSMALHTQCHTVISAMAQNICLSTTIWQSPHFNFCGLLKLTFAATVTGTYFVPCGVAARRFCVLRSLQEHFELDYLALGQACWRAGCAAAQGAVGLYDADSALLPAGTGLTGSSSRQLW